MAKTPSFWSNYFNVTEGRGKGNGAGTELSPLGAGPNNDPIISAIADNRSKSNMAENLLCHPNVAVSRGLESMPWIVSFFARKCNAENNLIGIH
ncbi:MAG TPA: hypothetical protein VFY05_07100 [Candidatus Angelobacter sp.]|nr:hypothetical protein [Candidatus Angelobacter sp.]